MINFFLILEEISLEEHIFQYFNLYMYYYINIYYNNVTLLFIIILHYTNKIIDDHFR